MANKVPLWAQTPGIEYPPRLALEQCSGQPAAQYKASLVKQLLPDPAQRQHLVDLTGGLGVDFSFMAPLFAQATYVEQQPQLCQLAAHNMPLLALPHAHIVNADATQHLTQLAPDSASLIFIDPARRSATGRKTVLIEDCQPDIITLAPSMLKAAPVVVVKLSTMLDIAAAVRALGCVSQVHIVATPASARTSCSSSHARPRPRAAPTPSSQPPASCPTAQSAVLSPSPRKTRPTPHRPLPHNRCATSTSRDRPS